MESFRSYKIQNSGNTSWACRLFSKAILKDIICNYKEVSDAVLAALIIHGNRNCGDQFCCGSDLAQTIRLQFAQLCWRRHRRTDSVALLGAIETQGGERELQAILKMHLTLNNCVKSLLKMLTYYTYAALLRRLLPCS
jgi:hypothetical protein